jgi:hypothetical protein
VTLRVLLLVAAVTWLFALVLEFGDTPALTAALLYHWALEHILLAGVALSTALAPVWVRTLVAKRRRPALLVRGALLVAAVTWGIAVPPFLVSAGLGGFLNELFGYLSLPASWGAAPVDAPLGAALLFHWAFQHLLLSAWAIAIALWPTASLQAVVVGEDAPEPTANARVSRAPGPVVEARQGD